MPKIIKFSGYYVDPNNDYNSEDVSCFLSDGIDLISHNIETEEVDIGEWSDNHPLNETSVTKETCENYFKKNDVKKFRWNNNFEELKEFVRESLDYSILDTAWEVGKGHPHVFIECNGLEHQRIDLNDVIVKHDDGTFSIE